MQSLATNYFCSLPNPGEPGGPKELFSDDQTLIERFIQAEDRPGRGVYECINPLVPDARRRNLETVAELRRLYFDLDLQHIEDSRDEVIAKLQQLPVSLAWVRDSGSSNLHVGIEIKDPPPRGTPEYDRGVAVWKRLAEKLAADPAPVHPAALVRCLGTHNTKNGNSGQCVQLWNGGDPMDLTELEELDDLLAQPLLTRKARAAAETEASAAGYKAPVDVDARLAAMRWHGTGDSAINITQTHCVASLLAHGIGLEETVRTVLDATRACVAGEPKAAEWDWLEEEKSIWQSGLNLIVKDPDRLADLVPDNMREALSAAIAGNKRPTACFRKGAGWHIRGYAPPVLVAGTDVLTTDGTNNGTDSAAPAPKPAPRRVFEPRPFVPFDVAALPPRSWLYGKHYQRRTVSLTAGPGGMGKSGLDMVEAIAMATARNLLGEQPGERLRVWYHNGDDTREEIGRRLAAICQYYKIPMEELQGYLWTSSGTEFPLRVAKGYNNLIIDAALVRQISGFINTNQIDVADFDPLVSLHDVSEMDTGKMDRVIRVFGEIADDNDAAIELAHHVRKPAPGETANYDVYDIRGVKAITDAVRAARVLNHMTEKDAEAVGCSDLERMSLFKVDRAKGNYSSAAQTATWRQFISVELANGDDVGVVAPWDYPGQGEQTPEKAAADQKADQVFLALLDKFTARGMDVSASFGPNNAPAKFAKEREAKAERVSKAALASAMSRLLDSGGIRTEPTGRSDRKSRRLVAWRGDVK